MTKPETPSIRSSEKPHKQEFVENLSQIEKRDWWLWGYALFAMLFLAGAIFSIGLPSFLQGGAGLLGIRVREAVLGLVAWVILFSIYAVHQQILIKRLRHQLAEKQGHSQILRSLAMIDPLTGLYNRRFGEQRLEAEVARSSRSGHPLSVVLLDINRFKQINDTNGHQAGDLVLQEFAARLSKAIRGSDLAVRLGGDEFLLILPDCRREQLEFLLARLGSISAKWEGQSIPVTFSAGWKQFEPGEGPKDLLAAADQALYAHKRAGTIETSQS